MFCGFGIPVVVVCCVDLGSPWVWGVVPWVWGPRGCGALCGFGVLVGVVRCAIDLWGPCGCDALCGFGVPLDTACFVMGFVGSPWTWLRHGVWGPHGWHVLCGLGVPMDVVH